MRRQEIEIEDARTSSLLPREIFSPASGGSENVSRAIEDINTQGIIRLKP